VEITDKDDLYALKSICKGIAVNDFAIPSCGCGAVELIFESRYKKVILYPGGDSCGTMRLGKADIFSTLYQKKIGKN